MQKTEKQSIDGVNYEIVEMLATKRSIIALEIKQIITGFSEGIDNDVDSEIDFKKSIAGILDRIEPEKGAYLLRDIIMNGVQFPVMDSIDRYDLHFAEHYDHQIELVAWIMELNFGKTIESIKKKLTSTGLLTLISSKVESKKKTD
jgi:hypothetical protein